MLTKDKTTISCNKA